jgi:chromosome segregation ATPase
LKNFCGITEAEVKFAPTGVTIVHGPNEVGKSTLMQGINVLFDHRDDSRKEEVRLTKPVNRDVGSEVEAEVEIGQHRFTYFKRFHKDRETRLTIHAPRAESLVGREAHERVQQILSGSVDTALWQALRIVQGRNLEMPELHDQPALAQALDRVAGQAKSGEKEEALFGATYSEHNRYFTDTGREKEDPIGQARTRAAEAAEKEIDLLAQLKEVEEDIGRFATLERSVATLKRSQAGLEAAQQKAQAVWDAVSKLAEKVERANSAHQLADQAMQAAKNAVQQRNEMISLVKAAAQNVEDATAQNARTSAALAAAAEALSSARITRDAASAAASQRDAEERIRRADHEFRDEEFELVRMEERLEHVRKADASAAAASALVAATKITDKLRASIRSAEIDLRTAQGILNSASPQFTIKALKPLPVAINGDPQTFNAGEVRVVPVSEPVSVTIASIVELRVEPGTSAETLRQAVSDAERALARACARAGVGSPEEAETAWSALQDAKRTVADRDRIAKEHLRDLTREELGQRIEIATAKVQAYRAKRSSDLALPATSEEGKALLELAAKAAADARKALQAAEAVFAQVQEHHAKCREGHAANTALLEQAKKDHALAVERLEGERKRCIDEHLLKSLASAEAAAKSALESLKATEDSFRNAEPGSAKAILDTSASALKKARDQCEEQDRELIALRTKLDLVGDKGLAESLAEAQRVAFEAKDSLDRLFRRAAAAKLLYETLRAEREAMRRAYVAPLREGIERLGRHVFGPTLRVNVDENLQVVSRTVDGVTVTLGQLSTGAREQMGLLVRLAAASMVSKDGGVPLVLDDALGSTDEGRVESMGAVLRIASQDIQTIILTCAPERYVHVGAETIVRM